MWGLALLVVLVTAGGAPCGLGAAARQARVDGDGEIWVEAVAKEEWRVALVNQGARTISLDVVWTEIGLPVRVQVWATEGKEKRGVVHGGFAQKLQPGACAVFRVKR